MELRLTTDRRIFYGWIVVAAAFVQMGVGYGLVYSLGNYIEPFSREFGASRASASFVFGLAAILSLTGGALAGPLADRVGMRPMALAGALAFLVGLVLASRAGQLWQVYLTASLGVGGGVAAVYVPSVATVQRWFVRRRGQASLIATSGLGAGTLAGPLAASHLIAAQGWRTASLVSGVVAALLTAGAGWIMVDRPERLGLRPDGEPPPPAADGAQAAGPGGLTLGQAARTPDFRWLYATMIGACAVAFFGYGHIVPYAEGRGLDPVTAALGLAAVGLGSWLGRVGMAPVTGRLGLLRSYTASIGSLAVVMLGWLLLPVPPLASLLAVGFVLGTAFGVFVGLSPMLIAERFGQRALSATIGAVYTGAGVGALLGPWLGGLAFDRTGSYHLANLGAAAAALAAAAAAAQVGRRRTTA
jgi:MFS transporter, OFA family, oxalate/formate antiporter